MQHSRLADSFEHRPHRFVGRTDELTSLREILLDRPVGAGVVVVGPGGIGKTALVNLFADTYKREFSGGVEFISSNQPLEATLDRFLSVRARRCLVVLDDAGAADQTELNAYVQRLEGRPNVSLLMTARNPLDYVPGLAYLALEPLTALEVEEFVAGFDLQPEVLDSLGRQSAGNPLAISLLAHYARQGNLSEVVNALGAKALPTILGPGGQPLAAPNAALDKVELSAKGVSDALISALAHRPELMYELSPRKFEELVAELYERSGFDVHLTQFSKDGGVDIYAIQRAPFGSFLTVVDCKRHRADRPVQVGLIKSLYGTVMATDASVGVIATTSYFTKGAKTFQAERKHRLGLQNFLDLHEMLRQQVKS